MFIHVPLEEDETHGVADIFHDSLDEVGVEVCTGPVVDFRLRAYWLENPDRRSIPLIYPHHFSGGTLEFPKHHKKPNALEDSKEVQHWLMPNECYVLVKRFSSKEEKRRVVAYIYNPEEIDCTQVGFENHWNVFHTERHGLDPVLAKGLACFLNSTILDKHFRAFSGHTQVNATDLRNIKYPRRSLLNALGRKYRNNLTQAEIDEMIRHT